MTMMSDRELRSLPKAHLHVHLDGAMRPATLAELVQEAGVALPIISGYGSFAHFSTTISAVQQIVRTPAHLRRLVRETIEEAALAGAVWIEPTLWPGAFVAHLGTAERVLEHILQAGRDAARQFGIGFGLMVAANRERSPAEAMRLARLAASLRDSGVVSFGLDGDEAAAAPEHFTEAFTVARNAGLLSTPHAGELAGPESVRAAMDQFGAQRILHGVRAVEDPSLLQELADRGICLDVCPTSNVLLSVVSGYEAHPLRELLAAGVRCSVNADDPLLFGVGLLDEYDRCRQTFGLGDGQLAAIARASLEASGAPRALVKRGVDGIDAWLASEPI